MMYSYFLPFQGFAVVKFVADNTVEYMPQCWLVGNDNCLYPRKWRTSNQIMRLQQIVPPDDWPIYSIQVLGTYGKSLNVASSVLFNKSLHVEFILDTVDIASEKAGKAIITSNIDSDEEKEAASGRKRR